MGDLVLTCTGDLSRNRHVGIELGKGKKLPQILGEMTMVAEGVRTAKSAYAAEPARAAWRCPSSRACTASSTSTPTRETRSRT